MSWRNPVDVWHYDKPKLDLHEVLAQPTVTWQKVVDFPQFVSGFRVHNRGGFNIYYGYQKSPTNFEELQAGVADFKSFCPRELWLANVEVIAGRDVDVYIEYWRPETEADRPKDELGIRDQLKLAFQVFAELLPWRR